MERSNRQGERDARGIADEAATRAARRREAIRSWPATGESEFLSPEEASRAIMAGRDEIPGEQSDARSAWESRLGPLLNEDELVWLVDESGRLLFPAFQFDQGGPMRALVAAFWTIAAVVSPWTAASWCVSPTPHLGGVTPVEWCREGGDADALQTAADRDANRMGQ
jgi:hypothetical protein